MVTQYGEGSGTTFGFASYNISFDNYHVTMQYQFDAWQYFKPYPDVISLSFTGPSNGKSISGYVHALSLAHPCDHLHTYICNDLTSSPHTAMPIHDGANTHSLLTASHQTLDPSLDVPYLKVSWVQQAH